ncbi:MAG: phosphoribosylformylglycinamidine synthase subunit PurS [Spirochaetota bacterium]|nr:phosphoribosylformylglycinamidine synthase subunit PurS [Spirochaetota bacterium]
MLTAKVYVTLKDSILDPQGVAVKEGLHNLQYQNVDNVRIGKFITLTFSESDKNKAEEQLKTMCEKLLANTVIENYTYEISEG